MTGDLASDDMTSGDLETGVLQVDLVVASVILTDNLFLRRTTSVCTPSSLGSGFFLIVAVGAAAETDGLLEFSLAFDGLALARCPCCLHDQLWGPSSLDHDPHMPGI